jgi:hypothetical protein
LSKATEASSLGRWDAEWYVSIVQHGYEYRPGLPSNVAFYPLFPFLMKLVGLVTRPDDAEGWLIIGIVIANLALLVAIGYLRALIRLDFPDRIASRTTFYLLIFSTSFFLSSAYPESLFLATAVAAFYYMRQQRWGLAAILGALTTLTRPQGFVILLPLAAEYMAQRRFDLRTVRWNILALSLIPIAFLGWAAYLYHLSGDPLLVSRVGTPWNRQLMPPWQTFQNFFNAPLDLGSEYHSPIDLGFTLLFFVLVIIAWRAMRWSYALFASTAFLVMISSGILFSIMRYGLELFPLFIVLALVGARYDWVHRIYLVAALALSVVFMMLFAAGYRTA